jgi:bacterioferritin
VLVSITTIESRPFLEELIAMTVTIQKKNQNSNAFAKTAERPSSSMDRAPSVDRASSADRATLIDGLNHDLAGEYQAIVMYTHYSAKLTGPYRRELRALFQTEITDEQGHAQFLADKIAALGGEPTTEPRAVPRADQPREMLEHALAAEKQAIADYNERLGQAHAFGDVGLKVSLENQVADETRHKEEIERVLAGWDER